MWLSHHQLQYDINVVLCYHRHGLDKQLSFQAVLVLPNPNSGHQSTPEFDCKKCSYNAKELPAMY